MLGLLVFYCFGTYLVIKFSIFVLQHAFKRYRFSSFPQMSSLFLIGDTRLFSRHPLNYWLIRTLDEMAENFVHQDKIFLAWLTVMPIVTIFNKNYIKEILSKNEVDYLNKGTFLYPGVADFAHNNLFTIAASEWKIRRKLLSQPFHPSNLGNLCKIVNFESKRMIKYLKNHECKDTQQETKKISLFIYFKLLFEYDLDNEIDYAIELSDQAVSLFTRKAFSIFMFSPFLYRFTSLSYEETIMANKMMAMKNKILNAKTNLKEDLKQKLESKKETLLGRAKNLSLIEILLMNLKGQIDEKVKSGGWFGFERKEITAQMDAFILAGVDTQSSALTYLFHDLAKYPEYQEKIYEEIKQVSFNNKDNNLTEDVSLDEVKQMTLLGAVIQESMRLKPVVQAIIRHITKETKLDQKYTIPAYTNVAIFIEKVLKDPDYFPNPLEFKPERFLGDKKDTFYTNIPFSAGPRNCVAKKVVFQVQSILTANLLKHFRIEFGPSTPNEIETKFEIVSRPIDKIELKFVPR